MQPGGGVFLDFVLPRTKRQWIIHNEFLYTLLKGDIHHEDYKNEATACRTMPWLHASNAGTCCPATDFKRLATNR